MVAPAVVVSLLNLLKELHGKLADIWGNHTQTREMARERLFMQVTMQYCIEAVTNISAREAYLQQQVIQEQSATIQAMIKFQTLTEVLKTLEQQLGTPNSSADVIANVVNTARRELESSFEFISELAQPEEALAILARLVRWQMTYAPFLEGHSISATFEGWRVLIYRNQRHIYFIAVSGNDPASAQIRYFRGIPDRHLNSEEDWQRALDNAKDQFAAFTPLLGDGIYDLIARLEANGIQAE